ncbi:MAG: glycosyltransferase, partial [Bacteroidales bacterium]|nr:glycosyltransferase [Bacteroidales bacterium]
MPLPTIYFAIPAMDELEHLPQTLECIARQDYAGIIKVYVCVNQPQSDYCKSQFPPRVTNNRALWRMLEQNPWQLNLHPIDRFTPEKAWRDREGGVGAARQCCINALLPSASDSDILINMDADTLFGNDYVSGMAKQMEKTGADAVLPQYYHRLSGNDMQDRAMLRYEIYMRCYLF